MRIINNKLKYCAANYLLVQKGNSDVKMEIKLFFYFLVHTIQIKNQPILYRCIIISALLNK